MQSLLLELQASFCKQVVLNSGRTLGSPGKAGEDSGCGNNLPHFYTKPAKETAKKIKKNLALIYNKTR
jgi:hypothetical protein